MIVIPMDQERKRKELDFLVKWAGYDDISTTDGCPGTKFETPKNYINI